MRASEAATDFAARCRGLVVDYHTAAGVVHAVRYVDAVFGRAELTVVAGPSGSGKSSLLRVLAGLQRPTAGQVEIDGTDVVRLRTGAVRRLRRRSMGIVLQNPADNLLEYLTAREQVELAARLRGADPCEATSLLDLVGLADRSLSYPHQLSGGEQQRVAFAAAAIGTPVLLLADEPTAELDVVTGVEIVATMRRLVEQGSTLVVASHDPSLVTAADRVVGIRHGRVEDSA